VGYVDASMVGLSETDMEQIREFAERPRYARSPEELGADEEEDAEE
jgi:hypothetical protein